MLMTEAPYTLPFFESFAGGKGARYWASDVRRGNSEEGFGFTNLYYVDNDKGCALYNSTSHNGEAVLTFGKISLSGDALPFLYFYYYALPGEAMKLKVLAYKNGGSADTLKSIDNNALSGHDGWLILTVRSGIDKVTTNDTFDVFTLQGVCIRRQATSLAGLKLGVYIVNGKKTTIGK